MEKALSNAERIILENINKKYQWISRDKYGDLYAHEDKPKKSRTVWDNEYFFWISEDYCKLSVFNRLFQFIQWTDNEPTIIADLLRGN